MANKEPIPEGLASWLVSPIPELRSLVVERDVESGEKWWFY